MFVLYRAYSYVSFRRCYFVVSFAPLRALGEELIVAPQILGHANEQGAGRAEYGA